CATSERSKVWSWQGANGGNVKPPTKLNEHRRHVPAGSCSVAVEAQCGSRCESSPASHTWLASLPLRSLRRCSYPGYVRTVFQLSVDGATDVCAASPGAFRRHRTGYHMLSSVLSRNS